MYRNSTAYEQLHLDVDHDKKISVLIKVENNRQRIDAYKPSGKVYIYLLFV